MEDKKPKQNQKLYGYDGVQIVEVKNKDEALSKEIVEKIKLRIQQKQK